MSEKRANKRAARRAAPAWFVIARAWYLRRPFLATWLVLAAGMVVMVVLFGHDAGLTFRQHATLAVVSVLLALACTWIIFLEGGDEADEAASPAERRDGGV